MAYSVTIVNDNGNHIQVIGIQALGSHIKDLFTTDYPATSIHKGLITAIVADDIVKLHNIQKMLVQTID